MVHEGFHHILLKYGHENAAMQKPKFDDVTPRYSMTSRWPLTPHQMRSHVQLYPKTLCVTPIKIQQSMWKTWFLCVLLLRQTTPPHTPPPPTHTKKKRTRKKKSLKWTIPLSFAQEDQSKSEQWYFGRSVFLYEEGTFPCKMPWLLNK